MSKNDWSNSKQKITIFAASFLLLAPYSPLILSSTEQITNLQRQLRSRELRIDALLSITAAINRNTSAADLLRIFAFEMRFLKLTQLLLLHYDHQWQEAIGYGIEKRGTNAELIGELLCKLGKQPFALNADNYAQELPPGFEYIIPVYHKSEPLAFLLIGSGNDDSDDTVEKEDKIRFIQTITNVIVVAIENKRLFKQQLEQESLKKELEVAQRVQNMLVPKQLPHNKRLDMEAIYMPHHIIGGDYYDYVALSDDEFLFCIADIAGKGIAAALLMANIQAMLRALAYETNDLRDLVIKLNRRIVEITKGDKHITLFIAKHNLLTRELTYINAGHNPPLLHCGGKTIALSNGCTILGVFDQLKTIQQTTLQLTPNAVFVAYTDGLTDLENDQAQTYSIEQLTEFTQQHFDDSMSDFSEQLLQTIKQFKGSQAYTDDITIVNYRAF